MILLDYHRHGKRNEQKLDRHEQKGAEKASWSIASIDDDRLCEISKDKTKLKYSERKGAPEAPLW